MKNLLKLATGAMIIISYLFLLLSATLSVQYLSAGFLISNFNKGSTYTYIEKALKIAAGDAIRNQAASQGVDFEKLTTGERAEIEKIIDNLTEPLNRENIRDFTEKNIVNFENFLNIPGYDLVVYVPISKLKINEQVYANLPDYLKSDSVNINNLYTEGVVNGSMGNLLKLNGMGRYIKLAAAFLLTLLVVSFLLNLKLQGGLINFDRSASYLMLSGFLTLSLAWLLKVISNTAGEGLELKKNSTEILVGSVVPVLFTETIKLWVVVGSTLILSSYFFSYAFKNYYNNKLKSTKNRLS